MSGPSPVPRRQLAGAFIASASAHWPSSFPSREPGRPCPPEPTPFLEQTVSGQTVHYVEGGTGPTVVLVHGLGGDRSEWVHIIRPLAERSHVIVPDLPGFLDALQVEHATLVGSRTGATR